MVVNSIRLGFVGQKQLKIASFHASNRKSPVSYLNIHGWLRTLTPTELSVNPQILRDKYAAYAKETLGFTDLDLNSPTNAPHFALALQSFLKNPEKIVALKPESHFIYPEIMNFLSSLTPSQMAGSTAGSLYSLYCQHLNIVLAQGNKANFNKALKAAHKNGIIPVALVENQIKPFQTEIIHDWFKSLTAEQLALSKDKLCELYCQEVSKALNITTKRYFSIAWSSHFSENKLLPFSKDELFKWFRSLKASHSSEVKPNDSQSLYAKYCQEIDYSGKSLEKRHFLPTFNEFFGFGDTKENHLPTLATLESQYREGRVIVKRLPDDPTRASVLIPGSSGLESLIEQVSVRKLREKGFNIPVSAEIDALIKRGLNYLGFRN
jgi:hypothetical protein